MQDDEGRGYFIVRIDTDAGIHGLGEAGIRNWSGAIAQAVDHLSELIVGADPWQTERLWQLMFRGGFFPAGKVYACAISAIDIALWDIKAKAAGLPVYRLLGGPVRDKGAIRTAFAPAEQAELAAARGARKAELFFRLWTMKEALLKALGVGLSLDTSGFEIPPSLRQGAPTSLFRFPHAPTVGWRLDNLGNADFAAAVAHELKPEAE